MKEMLIDSIRVSLVNYSHVVLLKEKLADRYLPIWIGEAEATAISIKLQNQDIARPMTHDLLKHSLVVLESLSGTAISKIVVNDLRSDTFYAQILFEFKDGPQVIAVEPQTSRAAVRDYEAGTKLHVRWLGREFKSAVSRKWHEGKSHFMEIDGGEGWTYELCFDDTNKRWLLIRMKLDSRPSDAIALAVRIKAPIYVEDSVLDKAGINLDEETGKVTQQAKTGEGDQASQEKLDEQELKKLAFYNFINTLDIDDIGKKQS